jgi:GNAT superfamily N-acetyltransferase
VSYELAPYEPAHRDDYLRLLGDAWGDQALTGDEFDWWFARNPAGSLMSVARTDGRVIGVASHSLYRMALEREERLATFSVHATTDDSARGQGIFPALERRHEEQAEARGAAVVLAFASKPTEPIFLGPLGWTEVGRLRIWARPLPGVLRPRSRAEPLDRFEFAGDGAASWPNHIVRDAEYLNWRYLDSPRGYRAFAHADGYAVLGHKRHRGTPIALVADLVGEPRPLLQACLSAARTGSRAVFAVPAPEHRAAYAALGFVPSPLSLHFMGKPLAGRLNPDPRAWRFTLGDTDFF